jgi:ribosomal protein S6--L-glutamate ligase
MLSDRDTIWRVFQHIAYIRGVVYAQRYLEHGGRDVRAFVIGERVVAAMYRVNPGYWKTNIARGARPEPAKLDGEAEEMAVKAAEVLGCEVCGVDMIIYRGKPYVLEVNSQPMWRGLQSVTNIDIAEEIVKYVVSKVRR